MKTWILISLLLGTPWARQAFASKTNRLVVTLDTPQDLLPEFFCIVVEEHCSKNNCTKLSDLTRRRGERRPGLTSKNAMIDDRTAITFATTLPDPKVSDPLGGALAALGRKRGEDCEQCQPSLTRVRRSEERRVGKECH